MSGVALLAVMFQELRNAHSEEIMGIRREEEMEMSDDDLDENPCKRMRTEENGTTEPPRVCLVFVGLSRVCEVNPFSIHAGPLET